MLYEIPIPTYYDGFTLAQFSCVELPLGVACGAYNHDYYYFYCMALAIYNSCSHSFDSFIDIQKKILDCIDLKIKEECVVTFEDFLALIKNSVNNYSPICFSCPYQELPYSMFYKSKENSSFHAFLIAGYDEEKQVIIIREYAHIIAQNPGIPVESIPYFRLQITVEHLREIFEGTKRRLELHNIQTLKLLTIYGNRNDTSLNFKQFLDKVLIQIFGISHVINSLNNTLIFQDMAIDQIRSKLYGSMVAFFSGFERFIPIINMPSDLQGRYVSMKENLLNTLDILTLKLMKIKISSQNNIKVPFSAVLAKQFATFKVICSEAISLMNCNRRYVERYSEIKADSEYTNRPEHSANNLLDVQNSSLGWVSDGQTENHWIIFSFLKEERLIGCYIQSDNRKGLFLSSYRILYRKCNDQTWVELLYIERASTPKNTHYFDPIECIELKIEVLKPCEYDTIARIYQFLAIKSE